MANPQPRPRRRKGRGLIVLLVVLLVVGAIAVAADRIAATVAEKEVTQRLVAQAGQRGVTAASTEVEIDGFPFLTQVARGKYERITITMHEARAKAGTQQVNLNELVVVATGVNADTAQLLQGEGDISADTLTGTARMDWADLATLTDYSKYGVRDIKFAPHSDGMRVTGRYEWRQLSVDFTASGQVGVKNGKLDLRVSGLRSEQLNVDSVPAGVLSTLSTQLSQALPPPNLPFGLVISDVRAEPGGLSVSATGQGVPLRQ